MGSYFWWKWDERVADSIRTSDGGYLIVGTSDSNKSFDNLENSRGGRDYWVVKLDDLGQQGVGSYFRWK